MASVESLKRQINIARGRIQRERNAIKRSGNEPTQSSRQFIAREQAFIRVAKQAIEAETMKQKFVVISDVLVVENKFLSSMGW